MIEVKDGQKKIHQVARRLADVSEALNGAPINSELQLQHLVSGRGEELYRDRLMGEKQLDLEEHMGGV